MPKCLNDATKTYKGDEKTPKGLGYSASGEKVGTVMKGQDGNDYIVRETKTCLKWEFVVNDNESIPPRTKKETSKKEKPPSKKTPKKEVVKKESDNELENQSEVELSESEKEQSDSEEEKKPKKSVKESKKTSEKKSNKTDVFELTSYKEILDFFNTECSEDSSFNKKYKNDFSKFFFDSLIKFRDDPLLKDCFFKSVYTPVVKEDKPLSVETGLEEKFGGEKPFFMKGETWPMYKSESGEERPYDFVCQYIDPLEKKDILVRLFLPLSDYETMGMEKTPTHITRIPFTKPTRERQIVIERPWADEDFKFIDDRYRPFPAYEIEKFSKSMEIQQFQYISEKFNLPSLKEDRELYNNLKKAYTKISEKYFPNDSIKIGGTRVHCTIPDKIESENIIQLGTTDYFNYEFGDNGIAHICYDNSSNSYYLTWNSE